MLSTIVCTALVNHYGSIEINGEQWYPGISEDYYTSKFGVAKDLFGWDEGRTRTWYPEKDVLLSVTFDKFGSSDEMRISKTSKSTKTQVKFTTWDNKVVLPNETKMKDIPALMGQPDVKLSRLVGEGIEFYEYRFTVGPEGTWEVALGFMDLPGLSDDQIGEHPVEKFSVGYEGMAVGELSTIINSRRVR